MAEEGKEGNKPNENTGTRQWGDEEHIATANYMVEGAIGGHLPYSISRSQEFLPLFDVVCGLWLELIRQGCGSCGGTVHMSIWPGMRERGRAAGGSGAEGKSGVRGCQQSRCSSSPLWSTWNGEGMALSGGRGTVPRRVGHFQH